jgi:hypothetical protein
MGLAALGGLSFIFEHTARVSPVVSEAVESGQVAAAWWSTFPAYSGYPQPLHCYQAQAGSPQCNYPGGWPATPRGVIAVFAAYPTSDPSQIQITYSSYNGAAVPTGSPSPPFGRLVYSQATSGPPVVVPAGQQLTLEWSCQRTVRITKPLTCVNLDAFGGCNGGSNPWTYDYPFFNPAVGTNFSTGGTRQGSLTFTPTSDATYSLRCPAAPYQNTCSDTFCWGWASQTPSSAVLALPVTANASVPIPPVLTITGNGTNPTQVILGEDVVVQATFTAGGPADPLSRTAINDFQNNLWCGTGCTPDTSMWTASPLSPKTYTFSPSAVGDYVFYPSAETASLGWNNYGQSLTVTVVASCPNGTGPAGACTSCNIGFTPQGGNCVPITCANGAINPPTCNNCGAGSELNGAGICVPITTCSDPNAEPPLCSTCKPGFSPQGGSCQPNPPVIMSFTASPSRVKPGNSTTLSWQVTNPPASCTITGSNGFSATLSGGQLPAGSLSTPVNVTTLFTLRCGSASPISRNVSILPLYEEL